MDSLHAEAVAVVSPSPAPYRARTGRRAGFPTLALLMACAGVAADDDVRGLISACADGNVEVCRQLDRGGAGGGSGSAALDARASAFAATAAGSLDRDGEPDLARAYPLIVADYFAAPGIDAAGRARWYRPADLPACAEHYAGRWLLERHWWPTGADGQPDWTLIYLHALDHYFGHCAR